MIQINKMFLLVLMISSSSVWAELMIRVTHGNDKPMVVAVSPIMVDGAYLNEDVASIVEANLQRTGLFKIVPREDMLSYPSRAKDVYLRDWRILGVEYLILGSILKRGTDVELNFSLINITSGTVQLERHMQNGSADIRHLAHLMSDSIYQAITGTPGIFSTQLAYVSAVRGDDQRPTYRLHISDVDGARERLILQSSEPLMSPTWSPDGRELAYVSFETGKPSIYRHHLATAKRQKLTSFPGLNNAPSWSPDGKKMALVLSKDGNPEIYLLDLESSKLTRLTHHSAIDTEPTWHPDGKSLLFTSDRGGTPQIYQLTIATKMARRLTFTGNYNSRPSLAPDGNTLALVHRKSKVFHIALLDLKTGRLTELTETTLDESPTVAPNGAMVMYGTKQGNQGVLAAISLDTSVKYNISVKTGDVRAPSWSPLSR